MNYGTKTNIEIQQLLNTSVLANGDVVFSSDWNEELVFENGTFRSVCSCNYIGLNPICITPEVGDNVCPPVSEYFATYIP